jgi:uncharacterized RDD family membrane protein YckC
MPPMSDTDFSSAGQAAYARFLPRLRALIVDWIIITVAMFAAIFIAAATRSDNLARPLGFSVAALWLLYEPLLVAFAGGTLGHRFGNLRVVDNATGGNVSFLKAVARTVIKAFLGIVSFVTMLTTRRSQAIHDLLTHSTVQIRDLSRAGPSLYVRERDEFANPALPSAGRRIAVILAYALVGSALFFGLMILALWAGLISGRCLQQDRCSSSDTVAKLVFNLGWFAMCGLILVFGWRGRLFGARRG